MASSDPTPNITLYTASTPNGQKASITLEELGLPYEVIHIDISKNTQKEDWYLKINPNGRIPALLDHTNGAEKRIFEGISLMLYLCQRYDTSHKISFPFDSDEYWESIEWMTWMQSGIGPMQGQANHFYRYAPEKIEYGINRYQNETRRLYQVLETRLAQQKQKAQQSEGPWIVGNRLSIADLACFSWVNWAEWAGVDITEKEFPEIKKWLDQINARPAIRKGLNVPTKFEMKEKMQSKEGEEAFAKYHSEWVMKGEKEKEGK